MLFERLQEAFSVPFGMLEFDSSKWSRIDSDTWLPIDIEASLPAIEEIARRGRPTILEDCAPLTVMVVPLEPEDDDHLCSRVAVGSFVTQTIADREDLLAAAAAVKVELPVLQHWVARQPIWPTRAIEQLGESLSRQVTTESQNSKLRTQLTNVSQHLLQTFEELNLLHRINERLSISTDERQLQEMSVDWLSEVLPAECLLACTLPTVVSASQVPFNDREWVYTGKCPVPVEELDQLFDSLGPEAKHSMVLIDREDTTREDWTYPSVREVICVPIPTTGGIRGWLMAINHLPDAGRADHDFGNLETSLLSSVASVIGMHAGNIQLFQEQTTFFESVVRAFSSAIDAKDPYTRGHSERVARIAVLLARKLGCSSDELNSVYLSGLLHDIGKIGIDDHILRKPGGLTPDEFEHIKLHPTLGYKILKGVKRLEHVLPVVLHHHESWDGSGYPGGLQEEEIPWLARIVSVADAFDAMSSDRPYRAGMPAEKLDAVFREKRGQQWDSRVIDAFFAIRGEIDSIISEDRKQLSLDVCQWTGK